MDYLKITNCNLGCMYAEGMLSKCRCACGGFTHGILAIKKAPVAAECSPAVAIRCKSGKEDGECRCACKGVNHAIYRHIENFEDIKITHYSPVAAGV